MNKLFLSCVFVAAGANAAAAMREVAAEGTYPAWLCLDEDAMPDLPKNSAAIPFACMEKRGDGRGSSGGDGGNQRAIRSNIMKTSIA